MTIFTSWRPAVTAMHRTVAAKALLLSVLLASSHAFAQQPGTSAVVSITLPSSTEQIQGWSVKHGLLGRPVYASARGKKIGTVQDMIIISAAAPYVLVIGIGNFIERHGHTVAVPIDDVVDQGGRLIFAGATRASLNAMPHFTYAKVTTQRAQFIHAASAQLANANAHLEILKNRAAEETGAAKVQLEKDNKALQDAITSAEDKLANLEKAEAARWKLFQKEVQDAISKVRASMTQEKAEPAAPAPGQP